MKLLLEVLGADQVDHAHEPTLETEIAAFVKALVKSRTRGHEPRVAVVWLGENDVCVNADQLLKLQEKAATLHALVTCDDRHIAAHLQRAKELVNA